MAATLPSSPGAINVSPVTPDETPEGKLMSVGTQTNFLPASGTDHYAALVTKAYNLATSQVLRRRLVFDSVATVMATNQSHVGSVVQFAFVGDASDTVATATLQEDYDVLPTPLTSWSVSIGLTEYGRVITSTSLLRGTSMAPIDPIAAERIGRNMASTIDKIALAALIASGGVTNSGGSGGAVADVTVSGKPSDTLRAASQSFKENNVEDIGGLYHAYLTPAAETALRKEADASGWRYWQINQDPGGGTGDIARGMVGTYEGFRIFVSTGVDSSLKGIFVGADALAKAHSAAPGFGASPQVVVAPVVDRLRRFQSIGWYWLGGYGRFRSEAVLSGDLTA